MKQGVILVCLIVFLMPSMIFAQGKEYYIDGKNFLRENEYISAENRLRRALDFGLSTADSAACYFGLAICSAAQNDNTGTRNYLRKALKTYPSFKPETSGLSVLAEPRTLSVFNEIKLEMIGKIAIESEPKGLEVFLDGSSVGRTPKYIDNVVIGNHIVKIGNKVKTIMVEAGETRRVTFSISKPENVRDTKSFGFTIDNTRLLNLLYRKWVTDFSSFQINLSMRGLASQSMQGIFGIAYLRHMFPDYDAPRSIVWGGEVNWHAISVSGEGTDKSMEIREYIAMSFIIGSEYYFKKSPIAISYLAHIHLARFDAEADNIFDMAFTPSFSFGFNLFW